MKTLKDEKIRTFLDVHPREAISTRPDRPDDYHCTCKYCSGLFYGEIYNTVRDAYYSQATRNRYYKEKGFNDKDKHLCPGHFQGYRYAIQTFTKPGDWVLDPTVGTGTTIVESINNNRNGFGIELEYPDTAANSIEVQKRKGIARGKDILIQGDARDLDNHVKNTFNSEEPIFDLVINGTPYPVINGNQTDAPMRHKNAELFNLKYELDQNIGVLTGDNYWKTIVHVYGAAIKYLKEGGKFCIIIKDPILEKEPYLLHEMICNVLVDLGLTYEGFFLHKHIPYTFFMRSYNKMYPEVNIPRYQTGLVFKK